MPERALLEARTLGGRNPFSLPDEYFEHGKLGLTRLLTANAASSIVGASLQDVHAASQQRHRMDQEPPGRVCERLRVSARVETTFTGHGSDLLYGVVFETEPLGGGPREPGKPIGVEWCTGEKQWYSAKDARKMLTGLKRKREETE